MTYVVTETCIKCKYTDCVDVCPVDCFREGPNFLSIDPAECIDSAACVAERPANAIFILKNLFIKLGGIAFNFFQALFLCYNNKVISIHGYAK